MQYRTDIDGLRAFAVSAVILFHLGYLPNGYLGVDVFFVISGYLITSIVYGKASRGTFSIADFYRRRIRRILPLMLVVSSVALAVGASYMLPDDLENLGQSVVASNFSANNILMYFTSADYWAVRNDYKPLMHTWSLGVEEQFYLFFPLLLLLFRGRRLPYFKYALAGLSALSLAAFFLAANDSAKFYFIQYRFFELALGGLGAIALQDVTLAAGKYGRFTLYGLLAAVLGVMFLPVLASNEWRILAATVLSVALLVAGKNHFSSDGIYRAIMANPVVTFIGAISYSLYMWHQVVFAFARYTYIEEMTPRAAVSLTALTVLLSVISYYRIENYFRKKETSFRQVAFVCAGLFAFSTVAGMYVYSNGGVIRDYPQLDLYVEKDRPLNLFSRTENIHNNYNDRINDLRSDFANPTKLQVLVIGNSFARDAANMLLESPYADQLEVRYATGKEVVKPNKAKNRLVQADLILFAAQSTLSKSLLTEISSANGIEMEDKNWWMLGTKDFGYSNGIHYNSYAPDMDYLAYRTKLKSNVLPKNDWLKREWGDRYIDLIGRLATRDGNVLVFTPAGKFISQDTIHLTRFGARHLAKLFADKIDAMMEVAREHSARKIALTSLQ